LSGSGGRPADDTPSGEGRLRTAGREVAQRAAQEVRAALRPFTIPNGITLLRLALTPFFVLATLSSNYRLALVIFLVAGLSDGLDGALARLLGMRSLLGTYLDPIADKTLLVSAFVVLSIPTPGLVTLPLWLTVMALSRDILIVLVALLLYLGAGIREFLPSLWGKATTVFQVVTIGAVLLVNASGGGPLVALPYLFAVTLALTVISGFDYVRRVAKQVEALHHAGE
jgi:cardiolipin synthase